MRNSKYERQKLAEAASFGASLAAIAEHAVQKLARHDGEADY
jgi:hypothetical protein